ncbi:Histone H2B [Armadillidium vulgare]|nr:Histone H2B [Armadillidium vulgare]
MFSGDDFKHFLEASTTVYVKRKKKRSLQFVVATEKDVETSEFLSIYGRNCALHGSPNLIQGLQGSWQSLKIYFKNRQDEKKRGITRVITSFAPTKCYWRIVVEAFRLAHYNRRPIILSREVQTVVRLFLPGELTKHAASKETKVISNNMIR